MVLARLVAVAAAAAAAAAAGPLALGGCYRDRAPGGTLENRTPAPLAAATADPLAFLPLDAEVVMGLDMRQVLASPLWKQAWPQISQRLGRFVQDFEAACGYDPLAVLRSVTVGFKGTDPIDGVFVLRGVPRDRTLACATRALPGRAKVELAGDVILIPGKGPGDPPGAARFADRATLVVATSRRRLDAALASGTPLRGSRAFSELWALVDARHALWGIANASSPAFASLASLGVRPRALLGSVVLGDGLSLTGRMRLGTPDEAQQLASLGQAQTGAMQSMVDRVEIGADGPDVTLRVDMTAEQAESMMRLMLGMLGSPLGGP
jgi:hypothetical protein